MIAVMEFCTECQIFDGVEFNATTVRARFNRNVVRIGLEFANRRVERIEYDFVRRVVIVIQTEIVYFEKCLAVTESPRDNRLKVHAVHCDVAPAERNIYGIAAHGKVCGVRPSSHL